MGKPLSITAGICLTVSEKDWSRSCKRRLSRIKRLSVMEWRRKVLLSRRVWACTMVGGYTTSPIKEMLRLFLPDSSPYPHHRKPQAWIQTRGSISPSGGQQAHLSALAYMSDSWFVGTVSRVHGLSRRHHVLYNRFFPEDHDRLSAKQQAALDAIQKSKNTFMTPKRSVGMMVSLDHTIYFHRPREVKADEWMCSEMETPWSGEGRGLVMQRIWNKEGRLIASCVQEVCLATLLTYHTIPF